MIVWKCGNGLFEGESVIAIGNYTRIGLHNTIILLLVHVGLNSGPHILLDTKRHHIHHRQWYVLPPSPTLQTGCHLCQAHLRNSMLQRTSHHLIGQQPLPVGTPEELIRVIQTTNWRLNSGGLHTTHTTIASKVTI